MLDDHSVIPASKSHAEPVEAGFCALSGRIREKSSFDQAPRQARGAPQDDFPLFAIGQPLTGLSITNNQQKEEFS
jgi:hypothetical protein